MAGVEAAAGGSSGGRGLLVAAAAVAAGVPAVPFVGDLAPAACAAVVPLATAPPVWTSLPTDAIFWSSCTCSVWPARDDPEANAQRWGHHRPRSHGMSHGHGAQAVRCAGPSSTNSIPGYR